MHPPSIPEGNAADWLRRLFVDEPENYSLRRYDDEQWDVMFFLQGRVEMILCDIRAGLPRRVMRFFIDGDNHRSNNNVGSSFRRVWRTQFAPRARKMSSWFTGQARFFIPNSRDASRAK